MKYTLKKLDHCTFAITTPRGRIIAKAVRNMAGEYGIFTKEVYLTTAASKSLILSVYEAWEIVDSGGRVLEKKKPR